MFKLHFKKTFRRGKTYDVTDSMLGDAKSLCLKVPKREIFMTELSILSVPIWIGNLKAKPKKTFVQSVRLIFAIFVSLPMTEYAVKVFPAH
jgi:hypothetical protein